jgi:hypothetical protein
LVVYGTGKEVESQLFDLTYDPDESTNLIHYPEYKSTIQVLDINLRTVVDYEKVAEDVASYNQESFIRWMDATQDWKKALADNNLRWHTSWDEAGSERAIEAIEKWLSEPPQVKACRKDFIWPPQST